MVPSEEAAMLDPRRPLVLTLSCLTGAWLSGPVHAQEAERRSSFGVYEGWSEPTFDEWVTTSLYVAMRDGVKLAVDVTRPAWDGEDVDERSPASTRRPPGCRGR